MSVDIGKVKEDTSGVFKYGQEPVMSSNSLTIKGEGESPDSEDLRNGILTEGKGTASASENCCER
jgi:hypothetical protein